MGGGGVIATLLAQFQSLYLKSSIFIFWFLFSKYVYYNSDVYSLNSELASHHSDFFLRMVGFYLEILTFI